MFLPGEMEEEFQDDEAVPGEILLKVVDLLITPLPDILVQEMLGDILPAEEFRMHAGDENLFVVRPVENADAPARREFLRAPPEIVVAELLR